MSAAHVSAGAIWDGERLRLDDAPVFNAGMRRLKLADGEHVTLRVERTDDAWRHSDVKHLFGHVYAPVVEYTGFSKTELHLLAKSLYMPEGRTSITELNRDELRDFTNEVEQWLRTEVWEAFERRDDYAA